MFEKFHSFVLEVAILEGRHYAWGKMDSVVEVEVDCQKKYTGVRYSSDCPSYNEKFVFEFVTTVKETIDKNMTITVYKHGGLLNKRKVLGFITLDLATIWYQEDHRLFYKWATLKGPSNEPSDGTRGYLRLDIRILVDDETPQVLSAPSSESLTKHMLLPFGVTKEERQKTFFIFDIFRGKDLIKNSIPGPVGRLLPSNSPTTRIEISFCGTTVKTQVKKNTSSPMWNERLVLTESIPPLCQRIKVQLFCDGKRSTRHINLHHTSKDFLPTFGPAFLHFYSSNCLEGYLGKILLSLHTMPVETTGRGGKRQSNDPSLPPIKEEFFLKYETIFLFATIFEVSSIRKRFRKKPISFRMACGPVQDATNDMSTVTAPLRPQKTNRNYYFLPIEANKPCLHLSLALPDVRNKMFNYNLLTKMLKELKRRIEEIEDIFETKDYTSALDETENLLSDSLNFITSAASRYIELASRYSYAAGPVLEQQNLKRSLKEMEAIKSLSKNVKESLHRKKLLQKIEEVYARIEALIDDVEDWPQIYLWMIHGKKRVAYHIIQARNILHSPVDEEKGVNCGVLRSIYFQASDIPSVADFMTGVCKMNIMIWMGLSRHLNSYIPHGFLFSLEPIPKSLVAEEKHIFEARVYVYKCTHFSDIDLDSIGRCGSVVYVVIGHQYRKTQTVKKRVHTEWDQTLVFRHVVLYGARDFMAANLPKVTIEIYDRHECNRLALVGKTVMKPLLKTTDELHHPPKLLWYPIYNETNVSAQLLTAVELVEVVHEQDESPCSADVRPVPSEIKSTVNKKQK